MFETNSNPDLDQTQFGNEGWLYEGNKPTPVVVDPLAPKKPVWWQTKNGKLILIASASTLMLILVVIWSALRVDQSDELLDELESESVTEAMDLGPLGEKVKVLRAQLKLADPTKEQDPFPPVKQDLRLDAESDF